MLGSLLFTSIDCHLSSALGIADAGFIFDFEQATNLCKNSNLLQYKSESKTEMIVCFCSGTWTIHHWDDSPKTEMQTPVTRGPLRECNSCSGLDRWAFSLCSQCTSETSPGCLQRWGFNVDPVISGKMEESVFKYVCVSTPCIKSDIRD